MVEGNGGKVVGGWLDGDWKLLGRWLDGGWGVLEGGWLEFGWRVAGRCLKRAGWSLEGHRGGLGRWLALEGSLVNRSRQKVGIPSGRYQHSGGLMNR